jgi:hypothetical protein
MISLKSWAKQYAKKHKFIFKCFNEKHCRISNKKKYIDFWSNGSYKTVNGKFITVPYLPEGYFVTKDEGFEIVEKIKELEEK